MFIIAAGIFSLRKDWQNGERTIVWVSIAPNQWKNNMVVLEAILSAIVYWNEQAAVVGIMLLSNSLTPP